MRPLARVDLESRGDTVVARITGEVDSSNAEEIEADLRRSLTNRSHQLVIDLTGTTYMDSAGINLLFALGTELAAHQQVLRLVMDDTAPVARVVRMTSLDRAHRTHPSVEEALAASPD